MGSKGRAASEKYSRNERLRPVPRFFPAMLGLDNPLQPAAFAPLPQHQLAFRKGEILAFAGFAGPWRCGEATDGALQAFAARRMIAAAHGLNHPAEQLYLDLPVQPLEGRRVDRQLARGCEGDRLEGRAGELPLATRTGLSTLPGRRRRHYTIA